MTTYLALLISVIVIYYSCELFVNGIEWVGKKLNISQCAVGTILAALGTALPESVVTLVAVAFQGSSEQKDIGVGAALGGPLVLGTLAYAVVGLCIILFRKKRDAGLEIDIDGHKLSRDQLWFVSIFIFKVLLGLVLFAYKPLMGFVFLGLYAFYFYRELRAECLEECLLPEPLKFQPKRQEPTMTATFFQTGLALVLIFASSHVFVTELEVLGRSLDVSPLIISLLCSPIATELPEILNAVIWVRQGKETLALGNISGAMMIQATVPSAFGLFFTPWLFDLHLLWSGIVTLLSVMYLLITLKEHKLSPHRLLYAAIFYLLFAAIFFFPATNFYSL
ncbi:MAG: sodium:calcium antiporter [Sporomusaceae bacterium]|nr:sodium:calcium antiporter [Sporomusaceae bacterium]